jgi:imidazolonepropionase-like amidohydrolase
MNWRRIDAPHVEVAGPLITASGGYPSRSWGSNGFAAFVDSVAQAERLVQGLATHVDVIKLALEPRGGPVPAPDICTAVVAAAHEADRRVTCHALSADMVERALDAGVDELAHMPLEFLPTSLVDRIAATGVTVVSTMQTHLGSGDVVGNARNLVAAGVPIRYGTDLGNAGIKPGADPRELGLLARCGLGADGALRAATEPIAMGVRAALVALDGDPRERPDRWSEPRAVCVGTTLLLRP